MSSRKEHRACGPLEPLGAPPARGALPYRQRTNTVNAARHAELLRRHNDCADPKVGLVPQLNMMYRELHAKQRTTTRLQEDHQTMTLRTPYDSKAARV